MGQELTSPWGPSCTRTLHEVFANLWHACLCGCWRLCTCVAYMQLRVCMCICMCMHIFVYVCTWAHTHIYTHIYSSFGAPQSAHFGPVLRVHLRPPPQKKPLVPQNGAYGEHFKGSFGAPPRVHLRPPKTWSYEARFQGAANEPMGGRK